ncbi:MAG: hypothetical protein ACRD0J_04465, partial [Acidimicrobiales bacterium]
MTATGSKARPAAGPGRDPVLEKAVAELSAADPVLSGLASRHGPPRLERAHDAGRADGHFADLVRSVLYQQLAGRAAAAIHARLVAAAGPAVTPDALLELVHDRLRGVGLSGAKTATLIG